MVEHSVLVAGGSRGIGEATVRGLLQDGYRVIAVARGHSDLERLTKSVSVPSQLKCYSADCSKLEDLSTLASQLLDESVSLSGLVLCVGSGQGSAQGLPTIQELTKSWQENFESFFYPLTAFLPLLNDQQSSVVFVSSIAGLEDIGAPPEYALSKAAGTVAIQALSRRLAPGIRLNAVAAGNTLVKGGRWEIKLLEDPQGIRDMLRLKVPLQRFGEPREIAEAIGFLISPKSSFITGQVLRVDGGQSQAFL